LAEIADSLRLGQVKHYLMNSSDSYCPPLALLSEAAPYSFRGISLLLCFVLCVVAFAANAQNLVVNGDFEAGTIAPWSGGELRADPTGDVLARVGDPQVGARLAQTVATVVGQRYVLSAELRNETQFGAEIVMSAQAQGGGFDGSQTATVVGTAPQNFTLPFTASSTSTNIAFEASASSDIFLVDDVSVIAIALPAAGQSYAGTMVTTVDVTDPPVSAKRSRKVAARINDEGELVLLDGTDGIITGYVSSTGEFLLILPDGKRATGNAVIRGRRIVLEYTVGSHTATTASGATIANTIKQTLTLVRR
jgi:hypothetical protein